MTKEVRTRYAPSPTGFQHLGGVRTALFCYLFAKHHGGKFILRIEDTDQKRFVDKAEDYIYDVLDWCGLQPDESPRAGGAYAPYKQSERFPIYQAEAKKLIEKGTAYYAFDTEAELAEFKKANHLFTYNADTRNSLKNSLTLSKEEVEAKLTANEHHVIRLLTPLNYDVHFSDLIKGDITINTKDLDDKVLLKSDGTPTYHLANVVDDYSMKITHVVRGDEWISSTPIHVLLYKAFGWEAQMPVFAHLPLVLRPDGKGKLSKRDGDKFGLPVFPLSYHNPVNGESAKGFKDVGMLKDAFINTLAFIGWNPGTEQEFFTLDELIQTFTLDKVSKHGAVFSIDKAKYFNEHYLRSKTNEELAELTSQIVAEKFTDKEFSKDYLAKACSLMKPRMTFLNDIINNGTYCFQNPDYSAENLAKISPNITLEILKELSLIVSEKFELPSIEIENSWKEYASSKGLKAPDVMKFLRICMVGELSGPAVPDLMKLVGKENALLRIENCANLFFKK